MLQLRRGLYALAPPWQKIRPHPFLVANRLVPGSHVSCQSALGHVQAIPEFVPEVTSCSGGRPCTFHTPLGRYSFRHLKSGLRFGYRQATLIAGQQSFLAEPEKAVLDPVYLYPGGDSRACLQELRLKFEVLRLDVLNALAALQRAGAMTTLAFQGGTCLRFVFNLPRYSGDMGFALEGIRPTTIWAPR